MPTAIDIAWAAGFWEGEGSCRLMRHRGLSVTAVQKDTETLYRLREWFGGNVRMLGPSNKDCHVWECCGDRGRIFFALIYSFLSLRRKVQVGKTGALDFLNGASPEGLSISELKDKMLVYYEEHRKQTTRSPEYRQTEEYRKYNREHARTYRAQRRAQKSNVVAIA